MGANVILALLSFRARSGGSTVTIAVQLDPDCEGSRGGSSGLILCSDFVVLEKDALLTII